MSPNEHDSSSAMPRELSRKVDANCDAFEAAWFAGKSPRIEDFLSAGDPACHEYLLRELLVAEWDLLERNGEAIDVLTYVERFPDQHKLITAVHSDRSSQYREKTKHDFHGETCAPAEVCDSGSKSLRVRCPSCHHFIELVADSSFSEVTCRVCGSEFSLTDDGTSTQEASTFRTVGHFELIERLGIGAFGSVWKARDTKLDRTVAVKIPRRGHLEPSEIDRFLREARTAAQLRHPNILSVHEVGRDGDIVFIVSDLVRGVTLSDWLTGQRMSADEAVRLCAKVGDALHHAHEQGVIHRDLKPQNIMLNADNEPHLMDFGLARRDAGETTMTIKGDVLGTPAYMSPEQARGEAHQADCRTDVYSLGAIFFQLLTGELPFRGNARMLIHQVLNTEAPSPRNIDGSVPRDLETICLKCLEKEPARRYPSARSVAEELRRYLRGEPIQARQISNFVRAWRWCERNPLMATLVVVAMGLVLFLGVGGPLAAYNHAAQSQHYRRLLYASDMKVVQTAFDGADMGRVGRLLKRHRRRSGEADLRGFEWYYLWRQYRKTETTPFLQHPGPIKRADFSPDGKTLAVGSPHWITLWTVASRTERRRLDAHRPLISDLQFSPDGTRLASAGYHGKFMLWSLDGEPPTTLIENNPAGVNCLAFSPDGKLATEGAKDGEILLWNPQEVQPIRLRGNMVGARSLAFSPKGDLLACGSMDGMITLWGPGSGEWVGELPGEPSYMKPIAFSSPDGDLLACGSGDRVIIWNVQDRIQVAELSSHTGNVMSVAFSRDGSVLASASDDGTVKLWSVVDQELIDTLKGHSGHVWHVGFSPDGTVLVSAGTDGKVNLWRFPVDSDRTKIEGRSFVFSKNGETLVSQKQDGSVEVWDFPAGTTQARFESPEGGTVALSRDGDYLARGRADGTVETQDLKTQKESTVLERLDSAVDFLMFSPDGGLLVSVSDSADNEHRALHLWDLKTSELLKKTDVRKGVPTSAYAIAFSPDSKNLATVNLTTDDNIRLQLWDLSNRPIRPTTIYTAQDYPILSVAFSADGRRLAAGSWDGTIRIWDVQSGNQTCEFLRGHADGVNCVSFSRDGTRLVSGSGDQTIKLWNLSDASIGGELVTLKGHASPLLSVAFTPDDRTLVSADKDGHMELWIAAKEEEVDAAGW